MPPKPSDKDEWAHYLVLCLQNIRNERGNLIQPDWDAMSAVTGKKPHTLYCRYNTHIMKPLDLAETSSKSKDPRSSSVTGEGGAVGGGTKKRKATGTLSLAKNKKEPNDEQEEDGDRDNAKKGKKARTEKAVKKTIKKEQEMSWEDLAKYDEEGFLEYGFDKGDAIENGGESEEDAEGEIDDDVFGTGI